MTDVDRVIENALADADQLFEAKIREATTTLLTVGGPDADRDVETIDDVIAGLRREWAVERAKVPGIVRRAVAAREEAGAGRRPGC